jgi:hypothetical protein
MKISDSANRVRSMIEKAIEDHQISRSEYETIVHLVLEDAHVDPQERVLIKELQDMIDHKEVKLVP